MQAVDRIPILYDSNLSSRKTGIRIATYGIVIGGLSIFLLVSASLGNKISWGALLQQQRAITFGLCIPGAIIFVVIAVGGIGLAVLSRKEEWKYTSGNGTTLEYLEKSYLHADDQIVWDCFQRNKNKHTSYASMFSYLVISDSQFTTLINRIIRECDDRWNILQSIYINMTRFKLDYIDKRHVNRIKLRAECILNHLHNLVYIPDAPVNVCIPKYNGGTHINAVMNVPDISKHILSLVSQKDLLSVRKVSKLWYSRVSVFDGAISIFEFGKLKRPAIETNIPEKILYFIYDNAIGNLNIIPNFTFSQIYALLKKIETSKLKSLKSTLVNCAFIKFIACPYDKEERRRRIDFVKPLLVEVECIQLIDSLLILIHALDELSLKQTDEEKFDILDGYSNTVFIHFGSFFMNNDEFDTFIKYLVIRIDVARESTHCLFHLIENFLLKNVASATAQVYNTLYGLYLTHTNETKSWLQGAHLYPFLANSIPEDFEPSKKNDLLYLFATSSLDA